MSAPGTTEPMDLAAYYRAERTDLIRLAYLLSGSRELAEDVVQAVFTDVHGRWEHIENRRAYFRRAVTNRVKDAQRRKFRQPPLPVRSAVTGIPELDETWNAVRSLPQRQREVVVLRFYEDLSLADIATILDRKPGTVRSELHRALARLKGTFRD